MHFSTARNSGGQRALALLMVSALACLTQANADEPDAVLAKVLAEQLHFLKDSTFATAKIWPSSKDKTIAAYVSPHKDTHLSSDIVEDDETYDLDIFVVKTDSREILQHYYQEKPFTSDAMRITGIYLDTANYVLKAGVRAFGIRTKYYHSGCTNTEGNALSLFTVQEHGLKRVLEGLDMDSSTVTCGSCDGTTTSRTLALSDTSHNGYRDLILRERRTEQGIEVTKDACDGIESSINNKYTLRFDGKAYLIPKGL